jgi:hypothetical protein
MHYHVSHYFQHKLNPCEHGFTKLKFAVTLLVCSQCQVDAIYFDLSSAFDLVPYALLHKFAAYVN